MLSRFALAVSFALVACGGGEDSADVGSGTGGTGATGATGSGGGATCGGEPERTGEATYYDFADGSGNCGFDATPNDLMVGAMNHTDYAASASCGSCAHLVGPAGEVTIRIVDQCPECKPGDIDLAPDAFEKIAALNLGRVPITWQYVECGVSGPLRYRFKEGSNQWWTALQIRNHRHAIAKVEYQNGNGDFSAVNREDYNYFVEPAGMGPGPYTFRVTDVYDNVITDTGIAHQEATEVAGASQFPACQ
jgi:expansin